MSSKKITKRQREIAGRLLLLRERLFDNASKMARSVNLTPQRWYNYETGRRALDVEIAAIVVEEHGVDFNWLYGGSVATLKPKMRRLLLGDPKRKNASTRSSRRRKAASESKTATAPST